MKKKKSSKPVDRAQTPREAFAAFNWKLAGILLLNSVVSVGVYMYLVSFYFWMYVIIAYSVALIGFILAYVIANRGFVDNGVTYEMLPDTMSDTEKRDYIESLAERKRKSRWMLLVIFPLLLAFIAELLNLYIIQPILG